MYFSFEPSISLLLYFLIFHIILESYHVFPSSFSLQTLPYTTSYLSSNSQPLLSSLVVACVHGYTCAHKCQLFKIYSVLLLTNMYPRLAGQQASCIQLQYPDRNSSIPDVYIQIVHATWASEHRFSCLFGKHFAR